MSPSSHTGLPEAARLFRRRPSDAHKGTMGHAALVAGSYGMLGAAILAARACLRSGVGKLTCFTDRMSYPILQSAVPEALFQICEISEEADALQSGRFQSIGIGPGIGTHTDHEDILRSAFSASTPLVLDADALNRLASQPSLWQGIPHGTVLTPHWGEYLRLFGDAADPSQMAVTHGVLIVLKGPGTRVYTPEGRTIVNRSGNAGMATAGAGDVLTGVLTGLLARGYPPEDASRLGVFLHGLAGDIAAERMGQESLIASDIIDSLPAAFQCVASTHESVR
jgi:hydroxyethylthiazole kinase-like uncharacterized protein yjeF